MTAADSSSTRVPASARAFLLSIYRIAVDHYQPKIEARTGMHLGSIRVWEHSKLREHVIEDYKETFGLFRSMIFRRKIINRCRELEKMGQEHSRKSFACYYKNAIYVSFTSPSDHEDWIAEVVVHELAHALWEKLGGLTHEQRSGLTPEEREQYKILSEGYASFAQKKWFRDIYPVDVRVDVGNLAYDSGSIYSLGFKRIQQLVNDHGTSVLLEIPRRWQEYSEMD